MCLDYNSEEMVTIIFYDTQKNDRNNIYNTKKNNNSKVSFGAYSSLSVWKIIAKSIFCILIEDNFCFLQIWCIHYFLSISKSFNLINIMVMVVKFNMLISVQSQ